VKIEPAKLSDAPALAKVLADWRDETDWMPNLHTTFEDIRFLRGLIQDHEVSVLRNWFRRAMGFMAVKNNIIHSLYLAPSARRKGFGRAMLEHAKATTNCLELWAFQANDAAIRFYIREGFQEVERTDGAGNDEKLPDIRMMWERSV